MYLPRALNLHLSVFIDNLKIFSPFAFCYDLVTVTDNQINSLIRLAPNTSHIQCTAVSL